MKSTIELVGREIDFFFDWSQKNRATRIVVEFDDPGACEDLMEFVSTYKAEEDMYDVFGPLGSKWDGIGLDVRRR